MVKFGGNDLHSGATQIPANTIISTSHNHTSIKEISEATTRDIFQESSLGKMKKMSVWGIGGKSSVEIKKYSEF